MTEIDTVDTHKRLASAAAAEQGKSTLHLEVDSVDSASLLGTDWSLSAGKDS